MFSRENFSMDFNSLRASVVQNTFGFEGVASHIKSANRTSHRTSVAYIVSVHQRAYVRLLAVALYENWYLNYTF